MLSNRKYGPRSNDVESIGSNSVSRIDFRCRDDITKPMIPWGQLGSYMPLAEVYPSNVRCNKQSKTKDEGTKETTWWRG